MEAPVVLVRNANDFHTKGSEEIETKSNSYVVDEDTWFLNNISYIFEDDEPMEQAVQLEYENVVIIDCTLAGTVTNMELLSEHWQLLSFDQNEKDNSIALSVMNELSRDVGPDVDLADLDGLARIYHHRNRQLRKLLDSV